MCLLSYYPIPDLGPVLTSNRDISVHRPPAETIKKHIYKGKQLSFPKDYRGGSWMAFDEQRIIFLLNGHKTDHIIRDDYARSRGLVLLDLLVEDDVLAAWAAMDLKDIEPFTIVYLTSDGLYELGWDYNQKHKTSLSLTDSHMWMSCTLYNDEDIRRIGKKFKAITETSPEKLMAFNEKNNYAAVKAPAEKIAVVETVCTYQLQREVNQIRQLELLHK